MLAVAATVQLGSRAYATHLADVDCTLGTLPAPGSARIRLPVGVPLAAVAGDPATLELDGGDGPAKVLTATVAAVAPDLHGTTVTIADAGAGLGALRPSTTYRDTDASGVIEALASDAGVDVGALDLALDLAAYAAHQGRTAAEHSADLALLAGAVLVVTADGELTSVSLTTDRAELALLHGRELVRCAVTRRPTPTVARVAAGNGPAGNASAPDALRLSPVALPEGAPAAGTAARWRSAPMLRTPAAASGASQALGTIDAGRATRLRATCILLPALRPGVLIEVQELPEALGEEVWRVTRVRHRVTGRSGATTFDAVRAGSGGIDLLGAALGALGALL